MDNSNSSSNYKKWNSVLSSESEETDARTYSKVRERLNKVYRISKSALPTTVVTDEESCVVEEAHQRVSSLKRKFETVKEVARKFSPLKRKGKSDAEKENVGCLPRPEEKVGDTNENHVNRNSIHLGVDPKNVAFMKLMKKLQKDTTNDTEGEK